MAEARARVARGAVATQEPAVKPLTRRELLNYVWLGSVGVFLAEMGGVSYLFAMPRFKAGEFGGKFNLGPVSSLPDTSAPPKAFNEGKFWLVRTEEGVLALYKVCTHLGCIFNWQDSQTRFICPCHGSQFQRNGTFIQGPAPRSLDRFVVEVLDAAGNVVTQTDNATGGPVPASGDQTVVVDTGNLIRGKPH
ncbi:MAG: Rieske 2Fe-2S domain-containing protein [Ardenticatenaceae bacterium]|nr:Rieske 2Fe-2S domain-containing protein [Ardenticatenaceae bacterium]HBY98570.1 cytochrome B6 [Chloroflexota bacterium]